MDNANVLENLAQPLIKFLRENHNPHCAIVVSDERVLLLQAEISIPIPLPKDC